MVGSSAPFLASLLALSLPNIFVWALTLPIMMSCVDDLRVAMMWVMSSLLGDCVGKKDV